MPRRTAFLYTDDFLAYNLGGKHPLQQTRLQMVHRLIGAYGLYSPDGPVDWITPQSATDDEIALVHMPEFIEAVQRASRADEAPVSVSYLKQYGLGPGDTPAFPHMYEAAALYAGGTIDAARLVLSGDYGAAFNVAGGLHHAHPDRASGFCTFNDLAMGIHTLLQGGCERVAYIDIDAHHGDGVQDCFYDDGRVLTVSLHQSPELLVNGRAFFPGTGMPREIGVGDGEGTSINVPLYPYTDDMVWHAAFDAVVPRAVERFAPDAYVLQLGADAHFQDPLTHLQLTSQGWMEAVAKLLALADGKPVVVTGGGGYNIRTVARLWTMVQAMCAGVALPDTVPASYDAMYNIPRLQDTELPRIDAKIRDEAHAYAASQVEEL
ncbi:MAG: acetoin utilization protein AcuC, partial [Armatimonadota bacterium]